MEERIKILEHLETLLAEYKALEGFCQVLGCHTPGIIPDRHGWLCELHKGQREPFNMFDAIPN